MRSNTTLVSLTLSAALALTGCRIEKPATQIPALPSVDSFTASAPDVAKGGMVTLSWKVSNATSIEIREASATAALGVPADRLEGTQSVTIDANSLFVLVAKGAGGSDARAVSVSLTDPGATDVQFQALPPTVPGGQGTTLVWTAPGARTITLTAGGQTIDTAGQLTSGAVTVTPSFDTTYELDADGVTKQLTVTVQPAVLTLVATPPAVQPGETITLKWTAAGADRVTITSTGRGQLSEITTPAMIASGTFTEVAPQLPVGSFLSYTVTAIKGTAQLSKQIDVFVGSDLTIVRFDAPAVAAAGLTYSVRWQTVGAAQVELLVDGAVVHQTASAQQASNGQFSFTSPARDFAVELIASDSLGGTRRQLAQVDSVGVPTALTLMANPTSVAAGTAVTLTYACPEARRIRIVDADGVAVFSALGQRAESGTVSVYPNASTTYTATADNLLGSVPVTNTATITVTGTPLTVAQLPATALVGQMVTLRASQSGGLYLGFPHSQVLPSTQSDFLDITSTGTRVLESGGNVASVDLPFSTQLWGQTQTGALTVSRAGWLAWGAPLTVNTAEVALPSLSAVPFLIAPYWDDLTLTANSAVFVQLLGDAPEQSLVVQWNRMQCGTTANTEATFQARIHQNGAVSFHYKTMVLNTGPTFSIGVQDNTRSIAVRSAATPTTNSALYFFSPVTEANVRVQRGSTWGGFVKVGNAVSRVSSPARAVAFPFDISVSEFMFRPSPSVANGQYVEVLNRTTDPIDLTGWTVSSPNTATSYAINGLTLAPGGVAVLGESTDPLLNDDAGVGTAWGSLFLARDAGTLVFGTADASITFTYTGPADGGTGASIEVDPGPFVDTTGAATIGSCLATRTFGSQAPQQRGSPGAPVTCGFGYLVNTIAPHFVDISDGGTALMVGTATVDGVTVPITLADGGTPAPVAFGARREVVSMSLDGWMFWGTSTTTNFSNKSAPSTSAPIGVIAPFWDDLEVFHQPSRAPNMYWKRFEANVDPLTPAAHWVFQWSHVSHYYSPDKGSDDFNFEVKLFEDGTIEYHYGEMRSGTPANFGDGNSATIWLENPAGTVALFRSINQAVVRPNTAVRFTYQP